MEHILALVLKIAVIGLLVHLVTTFVKMPEEWRRGLIAVAALLTLLWLLPQLGLR